MVARLMAGSSARSRVWRSMGSPFPLGIGRPCPTGRKYQRRQVKSKPGSAAGGQGRGFADLHGLESFRREDGRRRGGGRRGFQELAERPFEGLEVDEIDLAVVVEVAVGEELVGLAEVRAEDGEVVEVDGPVAVGVG